MENQKYTIAKVQQEKLIELDLDIKDAYILNYLSEIIGTKNKIISKIVDNDIYYWIKYDSIIKYLPILKIDSLKAISRRLANYEKLGLIKRHVHKNYNKANGQFKGAYTFISLTYKFSCLFEISSKIQIDEEEMEEASKAMGLPIKVLNEEAFHHENLKVPVDSHHEDSKVLSIEGTQKSFQNTPNNNTPNKKKTTTRKEMSSSRSLEFLKKYNINPVTKKNIRKEIPQLEEKIFKDILEKVEAEFKNGTIKNKDAVLFRALKGEWIFKETKEQQIDINKVSKSIANDCLSYLQVNWTKEQIYEKLKNDTSSKPSEIYKLSKKIIDDYFERRKVC